MNIEQFFHQEAFNILLYDKDNIQLNFNISNNDSHLHQFMNLKHGNSQDIND